jgi:predicted nucleic acid-binding protein
MILLDTNILIEFYRNTPLICRELDEIDLLDIAVNEVVCAELYYGARDRRELTMIVTDMEQLTNLSIVPKIMSLAVDLVKQHCLSNKLKLPDALIAATALYYDIELFTLNIKDFRFIPHLKLYKTTTF